MLFNAKRPVIMNGIEELAVRGDLLDRLLIVDLDRIPAKKRCTEQQLNDRFTEAHPRILGALLDAVSMALRNRAQTKLSMLPRMADFALWVEAAAPALGWKTGAFLRAYTINQQQATQLEIEASPIGKPLLDLLQTSGVSVKETTAGGLLAELNAMKGYDENPREKPKGWPADATRLSGALRRIAPAMQELGFLVHFESTKTARTITFSLTGDAGDAEGDAERDASVTQNTALESPGDAGDAGDAEIHTSSVRRSREEEEEEEEREAYRESMQNSVTSASSVTGASESHKTGDADSDTSVTASVTSNGHKDPPPRMLAVAVNADIAQRRFDAAKNRIENNPQYDWSDIEQQLQEPA